MILWKTISERLILKIPQRLDIRIPNLTYIKVPGSSFTPQTSWKGWVRTREHQKPDTVIHQITCSCQSHTGKRSGQGVAACIYFQVAPMSRWLILQLDALHRERNIPSIVCDSFCHLLWGLEAVHGTASQRERVWCQRWLIGLEVVHRKKKM